MRILRIIEVSALVAAGFALAPVASAQTQACDMSNLRTGLNTNCAITVDGRDRTFDVRVPAQLAPDTALAVDNPGFTEPGSAQRTLSGLSKLVDKNKLVLITTQGVNNSFNARGVNEEFVNSDCCGDALTQMVDDVKYFKAAIDAVKTSLKIDPIVVASSGISNGMSIGNLVACTAGDTFDMVAGVSFALPSDISGCTPAPGTIYSESHGDRDTVVGIDGQGGFAAQINTGPAREVPKALASLRGCDATPTEMRMSDNTVCRTFSGCDGGGLVQMCEVAGGQHGLYRNFSPDFTFDQLFEGLLDQAVALKRGGTSMAPVSAN